MPPKRVPRASKARSSGETPTNHMARTILYEWWYSIAETIFDRVCKITELDDEQKEALRSVALRPNDFHVFIDTIDTVDSTDSS